MTYTLIYNLCTQLDPNNHAGEIYNAQRELMKKYIEDTILPPLKDRQVQSGGGMELLMEFQTGWKNFKCLRHRFGILFKVGLQRYARRHSLPSIIESATETFKTSLLDENLLDEGKGNLINALVEVVLKGRDNQEDKSLMIDDGLFYNIVQMFHEIGISADVKDEVIKSILEQYIGIWMREQNCNKNSIEEFISMTKEKVIEKSEMLVNEYGIIALVEPRAQNIITREYFLEELILQGLNHERNGGAVEIVRKKLENKVFDAYDEMEKSDGNGLISRCIETSRKFYARLRSQWSAEKSIVQYMVATEEIICVEACRISFYMRNEESVEWVIQVAKEELVVKFANEIVENCQKRSIARS
eukprot:CAMPEP_0203684804 /NCGR_PEP_ID=MMETSP0090-20130426/48223_1 /ASSEMBLY_ACC=CAM_ASM_001088 /TAXON_ID=426623 /ORGANISM="Chaetoceros affinis, Strain CCMP159" /LENGTH=357 /DNA_ID=CAMNT_0050553985 /DNA_START=1179 /DNA_END=2252 /DNA_ORIENTATION=+